jgi:phosphoribosyl-AMP cyclohydrolase
MTFGETGQGELSPLPVRFDDDGLIPAVVQDSSTGEVLMVAFMNEEALAATRRTGRTHFWSRSRNRLWRKGETSGHEQIVDAIHVNCEEDSLLLSVRQVGAVCHTGYPTCFYRQWNEDGTLTVTHERAFDPEAVYGQPAEASAADSSNLPPALAALETASQTVYGAFAFLRDNDFQGASETSRRLHDPTDDSDQRVPEELRELAGVLDGSHGHHDLRSDLLLEGGQVTYWVLLSALRARVTWEELRPNVALQTREPGLNAATVARMLRSEADTWERSDADLVFHAARCHATLSLVAQALGTVSLTPEELLDAELLSLREKPYLRQFFEAVPAVGILASASPRASS